MAFFNRFPYTNFHELNLDWILERLKELGGTALVKTVNNVNADSDGNISLTGADIPGVIRTVNNQSGDSDGNVNVGTVTMVNNTLPSSTGNVNVGTVRTVNGVTPESNGNVSLLADDIPNIVKTVNNTYPTNGNVDVGTVRSVNNSLPDLNGNVNLPSVSGVTSVNGIGADAQGNVELTPSDIGALPDTTTASDIGALPDTTTPSDIGASIVRYVDVTRASQGAAINTEITVTGLTPANSAIIAVLGYYNGAWYTSPTSSPVNIQNGIWNEQSHIENDKIVVRIAQSSTPDFYEFRIVYAIF